jgi:hypothetical protein
LVLITTIAVSIVTSTVNVKVDAIDFRISLA